MTTQRAFGDKLAALRRRLGFTQLELALRTGVSERTVRNAEGSRPIKRDFLAFIANGLDVPLEDVVYDEADGVERELEIARRIIRELEQQFDARCRGVFGGPKGLSPSPDVQTGVFDEAWRMFDRAWDRLAESGSTFDRLPGASCSRFRPQLVCTACVSGTGEFAIKVLLHYGPRQAERTIERIIWCVVRDGVVTEVRTAALH